MTCDSGCLNFFAKSNAALLAYFPVALFASIMGLAGLSIAWLKQGMF
ncbi:hypothetical protein OURE66S_04555 [Oligella ureolytica]